MKVCVVVDDNYGMMFNYRRQSKDIMLRNDILKEVGSKKLWISKYSLEQFKEDFSGCIPQNVIVDDDFLRKADVNDICFNEEFSLKYHEQKIDELIIYHWNRRYPGDFYLDIDLMDGTWDCVSCIDIPGNSHEVITKEKWRKRC